MSKNYYHGTPLHPRHFSVGAFVYDEERGVLVHEYRDLVPWGHDKEDGGCVVLMRESIEIGETLEQAVSRGLKEEFGATGEIVDFLGTLVRHFKRPGSETSIEKTTVYFLVRLIEMDPASRNDDIENSSSLKFYPPRELIPMMKEQGVRLNRDDCDESTIVERAAIVLGR